ncbi:AAA family ATPase, partial [Bifidobacterium longum]
ANTETNLSRLDDLLGEIHRQLGPLGRQARISRRADAIQISVRDAQARLYAEDAQRSMSRRDTVRQELGDVRNQLAVAQRELAQVKVRIEQVETLSSESSPAIAKANQYWHEFSQTRERLNALAQLAEERSRSLTGQIVTNFGEDPGMLVKRAEELESQAAAQTKAVADARIALDKATEERADDEKKLASVRQTLTELRKTAQERDAQIARLRELIAREESAVQLATSRAKDYASQRDSLTSQRDDAQQQLDALRSEADSIADDDGAALDAARATLAECRERLNELADKQREIQSKIISLKAKADALADTLDSRNASGSLERDTDVASLGRLTDFIHVAEGWEDAVAHALDQYASAIVVPEAGNMLHALERAREDKLGKAVVLTASIAGDSATEPGTESEESSAENTAAAPRSGSALAALVTANPDAKNPAQAEAVVHTVRLLLADVAMAGTADEAQQIVASGEAMRAVSKNGETFAHGVAAVGGSSISQSDLSLAARRDKALAQVKQLTAQDGGMAEQVAEAKAKRDEAARLVDQESAKRTEARLKAQQAEKSLKSATDRIASFTRQLDQLDRKITETQENRNEHQRKLDDLNRALASARQSTAEHADFDELDERERTLERGLNLTREHEVAAKIAWTEASRKGESLSRQAGLLRDNAKEAAERRARIEALNDRRREQAAHLQGVADDARAVAAMVEHTLHDVAAKRDELQAAASSHDEELKALRAQRNQIEPKVTDLTGREHALDVNRERLAAESGQLMQKVSDELGLTLEELVSDYGPEQPVPVLDDEGNPVPLDETEAEAGTEEGETGGEAGTNGDSARFKTVPYNRQEQKKRLDKARRELAALGKINPLATEEFEALEERNKYLNDQRNDVVKSRDDLMQLIKDLDSTMVQVFKSAFDDTAEAFEQMFATLFPGGTGRLRLENPEDMLTTGVLVEASPAGKRVKQLSLLSGGERSLTALALLFAIFTARPSPFYVMDEVEAALDDVNLTRLINAFNELRAHAQLIIITHQQRTMSIADALYGVTMRADGVTAVVSQKLER